MKVPTVEEFDRALARLANAYAWGDGITDAWNGCVELFKQALAVQPDAAGLIKRMNEACDSVTLNGFQSMTIRALAILLERKP